MKIKWFGQACFMITSDSGTKLVTDPYANMLGYKLPEIEAQIVTTSHNHSDHNNVGAVKGNFEHINAPGSFSAAGIGIKGVETFHDKVSGAKRGKNIVYIFTIDGLNVCHCGDLGHILSPEQVKAVGVVDILLLPIGGKVTLDAAGACEVMKQLSPKIVIPMHYRTKAMGLLGLIFGKIETFMTLSELDAKKYKELDVSQANIKDLSGIAVLDYQ